MLLLDAFELLLFYQLHRNVREMGALTLLGTQQKSKAPSWGKDPRCRVLRWALFLLWVQNMIG